MSEERDAVGLRKVAHTGNDRHRIVDFVEDGHLLKLAFAPSVSIEIEAHHPEAFLQQTGCQCPMELLLHVARESVANHYHVTLFPLGQCGQLQVGSQPSHGTFHKEGRVGLCRRYDAAEEHHQSGNHTFESHHKSFIVCLPANVAKMKWRRKQTLKYLLHNM